MNDPADPGSSKGPLNPNEAPEHLSRFNDQFDVADLRSSIEIENLEDVSLEPELNALPVPSLSHGRTVYLPSMKLGNLIQSRVPEGLDGLLIASFYRLSRASLDPILQFCIQELVPLVILAAASSSSWREAILPPDRKRNAVLMCFPGSGLKKHLGIALPDTELGRIANGLFLVNRPAQDHVARFLAVHLPSDACETHDVEEIRRTLKIVRQLPSR